jgi:phosphoglycerate kinase
MNKLQDHLTTFSGSSAVVRVNYDVPMENNQIGDTTRIEDSFPTINALLKHNCRVTLLAHAGRPDGKFDPKYSLKPIADYLSNTLNKPVTFFEYHDLQNGFHHLSLTQLNLIDNLRYWPEEEENKPGFAQSLSQLGKYYVNESFATCHRNHASITGIPEYLQGFAGLSLAKEVELILQVKQNPRRPLVLVMGGAKLETKEPLINAFLPIADHILVGGKLALDLHSHSSKLDSKITLAELVASGKDISPDSASQFVDLIKNAGTVIWNGSMGVFEEEEFQHGTKAVAEAVNNTPAFTLVGGGDTEAALSLLNAEAGIDHISSGGGAMLELLINDTLPGIKAVSK